MPRTLHHDPCSADVVHLQDNTPPGLTDKRFT